MKHKTQKKRSKIHPRNTFLTQFQIIQRASETEGTEIPIFISVPWATDARLKAGEFPSDDEVSLSQDTGHTRTQTYTVIPTEKQ